MGAEPTTEQRRAEKKKARQKHLTGTGTTKETRQEQYTRQREKKQQKEQTNMKLYNCIIDDGKSIFREFAAAKNKKELLDVYGGNGNFEKIEDVTNEYFTDETCEKLNDDLLRMGWGEGERRLICALVEEHIDHRK